MVVKYKREKQGNQSSGEQGRGREREVERGVEGGGIINKLDVS